MKEQILHHATALFARHGFNGTSLQMIADAVGITKASLLYHYKKDRLREEVLKGLLARWKEVLPQVLLAATTNGKNRLDATLEEGLSFFQEDPNRARLLMREILDAPEAMRARITEHVAPWMGLATDTIRRGQKDGVVRPDLDPEAYVTTFIILILGAFATAEVSGGVLETTEDYVARFKDEIIRIAKASLFVEGFVLPNEASTACEEEPQEEE